MRNLCGLLKVSEDRSVNILDVDRARSRLRYGFRLHCNGLWNVPPRHGVCKFVLQSFGCFAEGGELGSDFAVRLGSISGSRNDEGAYWLTKRVCMQSGRGECVCGRPRRERAVCLVGRVPSPSSSRGVSKGVPPSESSRCRSSSPSTWQQHGFICERPADKFFFATLQT